MAHWRARALVDQRNWVLVVLRSRGRGLVRAYTRAGGTSRKRRGLERCLLVSFSRARKTRRRYAREDRTLGSGNDWQGVRENSSVVLSDVRGAVRENKGRQRQCARAPPPPLPLPLRAALRRRGCTSRPIFTRPTTSPTPAPTPTPPPQTQARASQGAAAAAAAAAAHAPSPTAPAAAPRPAAARAPTYPPPAATAR